MDNLARTSQHSSYWLDQEFFQEREMEDKLFRFTRLASIRNAISNFVTIACGKKIPVVFSGETDSYATETHVVIGATTDPTQFDVQVGLALHEGSHILLSDMSLTNRLNNSYFTKDQPKQLVSPGLSKVVDTLPETLRLKLILDVFCIANVLEDRRVDQWMMQRCPGYVPYYNALYQEYFFTPSIKKNLINNPNWQQPTISNYIQRIILAHHPDVLTSPLPHLHEILAMMGLDNLDQYHQHSHTSIADSYFFEDQPLIWQTACRIYERILEVAIREKESGDKQNIETFEPNASAISSDEEKPSDRVENDAAKTEKGVGEDTSILDDNAEIAKKLLQESTSISNENVPQRGEKRAQKDLADILNLLRGNVKKERLSAKDQITLRAVENGRISFSDLESWKTKCIVIENLTEEILTEAWCPLQRNTISSLWADKIAAGKRMGRILHQRLLVRNEERRTKRTRLERGLMDKRLIAQLGIPDERIFYTSIVNSFRPVLLYLTLDGSGSMSYEYKWGSVLVVAMALAYLSKKMENIRVIISIRSGLKFPVIATTFDSKIHTIRHAEKMLGTIFPSGNTPEGLTYEVIKNKLMSFKNTYDIYFINFSDGLPQMEMVDSDLIATALKGRAKKRSRHNRFSNFEYSTYYSGKPARIHTRSEVIALQNQGIHILSYFIGEEENNSELITAFKEMYGSTAEFIDVTNVTQVLTTLNKLLLKAHA